MRALARHSESRSLSLEGAVAEFLEDRAFRNLSPQTIEWYRGVLEPFVRYAMTRGVTAPADVTRPLVRAFLAEQSRRVAPHRVNHYRDGLVRLYGWLVAEGCVTQNPADNLPKLKEPRKLTPTFTEDEMRRLFAQPDRRTFLGLRDYLFMLVLLDTGIRLSEALGLKAQDIDFDAGTLKVMGKGSKERMVGFSSDVGRQLRLYVGKREAVLHRAGRADCPFVFPNQDGGRAAAQGFQKALRRYGQRAGITRVRVSPHTFRHTFAVWFVREGGSPFHLQKILGHTTLDMSRRYCELADVDAITRQQELSPVALVGLAGGRERRLR
jgi:site-specific recombinase XerD